MLEQYKYISIIYGNTGRDCATYLAKCIEDMHIEEGFPIKAHLLADEILNSGTILDTIKALILSSKACIVILTFDDVEKSRVRQNVLIEIGMAASCIDRDKCFYISEKVPLPDDFPSDIRSSINPNFFDKNNLEDVFAKMKPAICKQLNLESNKGLLEERYYEYDYKNLLNDIPVSVINEPTEDQMNHILSIWTDNIRKYDFVSERIMYLAERISFFPNFKNNELFFKCMKDIDMAIKPSKADLGCYDSEYLRAVCRLFRNIVSYTAEKLKPETLAKRELLTDTQVHQLYKLFSHISDDIQSFIDKLERKPEWSCNRLIEILAYDYAALVKMKGLSYRGEINIAELEDIETKFIKVVELADEDDRSDELWKGYAFFNLSRLYEQMYRLTKNDLYVEKMRSAISEALFYRHEWLDADFEGAFGIALTFEYFLASRYDYETRFYIGTREKERGDTYAIIEGLKRLKSELSEYCESIDVGRLFEMRDSIDFLIDRINAESQSLQR